MSLNAFEEAGLEYEDRVVNVLVGEQHSESYREINPRGKIPAVLVGDQLLTENAAILMYVHSVAPASGILPATSSEVDLARQYSDLIWCSSTLHPAVRQVRVPVRFTTGDAEGVVARGAEYVESLLADLDAHFDYEAFWYGDTWSIMDVYLYWCYTTAGGSDTISLDSYPSVLAHADRVSARPSYQRALRREQDAMERSGMVLPGGVTLT